MSGTPETEVVATMVLRSVELDESGTLAIAVLVVQEQPRLYLPIFVTLNEGQDLEALNQLPQEDEHARPRLPEVFTLLASATGSWVRELVITRIQDTRLMAQLHVTDAKGGMCVLDIHVVDGLKVALHAGATIYATESVLTEAGALFPLGEDEPDLMDLLELGEEEPYPYENDDLDEDLAHSEAAPALPEISPKRADVADGPRSFFGEINLDDLKPADFGKYRM